MKIICDAPGQTCNRLWSYVATLSECIVKKKRMVILFFDYTIEDYPHFKRSSYIYFPLYWRRYLEHGNGWNNFKGLTWKACHSDTMHRIYRFLCFTYGWHTRRDTRYIKEAKRELQQIFRPKDEVVKRCDDCIQPYKEAGYTVVGVHVRRGDYATWNGGRFYFSHEEYRRFMLQITRVFGEKKIAFFISSNEKYDDNCFEGLETFSLDNASAIEDLHALSLCDYITGPVSTFSRWASFIGEKPLCFLMDRQQNITADSFSKIADFYHFENGEEIYDW